MFTAALCEWRSGGGVEESCTDSTRSTSALSDVHRVKVVLTPAVA